METHCANISNLLDENVGILNQFFHHVSDMVFVMKVLGESKYEYVMVNPAGMNAANISSSAIGKCIEDVMDEETTNVLNYNYDKAVQSGRPYTFVCVRSHITGESNLTPIFDSNGVCTHVLAVTRDVTSQKKREEQLEYLAYHDVLTGLPNRTAIMESLQHRLAEVKSDEQLAVLFLDCDSFKTINDTWGHDIGDQYLQWFASKLRTLVKNHDAVGRLGGDEFVIIASLSRDDFAASFAQNVLSELQTVWQKDGREIPVTTSIGVATYNRLYGAPSQLLKRADIALYKAKSSGGNRYVIFTDASRSV